MPQKRRVCMCVSCQIEMLLLQQKRRMYLVRYWWDRVWQHRWVTTHHISIWPLITYQIDIYLTTHHLSIWPYLTSHLMTIYLTTHRVWQHLTTHHISIWQPSHIYLTTHHLSDRHLSLNSSHIYLTLSHNWHKASSSHKSLLLHFWCVTCVSHICVTHIHICVTHIHICVTHMSRTGERVGWSPLERRDSFICCMTHSWVTWCILMWRDVF